MSTSEFGTGAVKITPAHDFNDFALGQRHGLEPISIFTLTATINDNAPEKYRGMDRYVARKAVLADLRAADLVVSGEAAQDDGAALRTHRRSGRADAVRAVVHGDEQAGTGEYAASRASRSREVALDVVARGEINIFPEQWKTIYNQWLENIQDWCISRQLWWGHQIPAWYDQHGKPSSRAMKNEARAQGRAKRNS